MSFFRRLFGGTRPEEDLIEADRLFEAKQLVDARVAYERLAERRDVHEGLRGKAIEGVTRAADALAVGRLEEAERLARLGETELARAELASAAEIAKSEPIRKKAARQLDTLEKAQVRISVPHIVLSADERWALLAGNWPPAQLRETDRYGETYRVALLAMQDAQLDAARPILEGLARDHEGDGVYLFLEVARLRLAGRDEAGCGRALRMFLDRVGDEDRSDARVHAYGALAQLADRRGEDEQAVAHLEQAIETMPDDPRPLLQMGSFLRAKGEAASALPFLEAAVACLDEDQPSDDAHLEVALALRDLGRRAEAIDALEVLVRRRVSRGQTDLPRALVWPLAELREAEGELARAADLYAILARGSDLENRVEYHRRAGTLLRQLGLRQEARRMLARASALAEASSEVSLELESLLAELEKDE